MRPQTLIARLALTALIIAVLMAGAAIIGVRAGALTWKTGLTMMVPATVMGVIALACALSWLRLAVTRNVGYGKRSGLVALIGSLAFLYPPLSTEYRGFTLPPIHDASTDPDQPPQFVALAKLRKPGMNSTVFNGQDKIHYKGEEQTISYALHEYKNGELTKPGGKLFPGSASPAKTLFWRCFETVKGLGWTIIDYNENEGRIEATATSLWFGQISDIVIQIRPSGFMGARAVIRAESREGTIDYGRNIGLLRAFRSRS